MLSKVLKEKYFSVCLIFPELMVCFCPPPPSGTPPAFSWHWWYVVMAIAGAMAIAVLMAVYVAKLRRKETRFGCDGPSKESNRVFFCFLSPSSALTCCAPSPPQGGLRAHDGERGAGGQVPGAAHLQPQDDRSHA